MPAANVATLRVATPPVRDALRFEIGGGFRDRHQPAQHDARQRRDGPCDIGHLVRREAALARFATDVDLQTKLQRR